MENQTIGQSASAVFNNDGSMTINIPEEGGDDTVNPGAVNALRVAALFRRPDLIEEIDRMILEDIEERRASLIEREIEN